VSQYILKGSSRSTGACTPAIGTLRPRPTDTADRQPMTTPRHINTYVRVAVPALLQIKLHPTLAPDRHHQVEGLI
jgi:hypothetical protein